MVEEGLSSLMFHEMDSLLSDIKISKFKNTYERQKARECSGESQNFMQCKKKEESIIIKAGQNVYK